MASLFSLLNCGKRFHSLRKPRSSRWAFILLHQNMPHFQYQCWVTTFHSFCTFILFTLPFCSMTWCLSLTCFAQLYCDTWQLHFAIYIKPLFISHCDKWFSLVISISFFFLVKKRQVLFQMRFLMLQQMKESPQLTLARTSWPPFPPGTHILIYSSCSSVIGMLWLFE